MGNRAVIAIKENGIKKENPPCIYLHWNGGRDSVEGFLETHNKLGMRGAEDASYALARLTQIIANALGGELSCGITTYECADTDNGDNGVYWLDNVDGKLQIVEREYEPAQEQQNYDLEEFTNDCLKAMPESYQSTKKGDIK
tara:strand:+ start:82 stop:507 length:426 start_codon:yes stop_codon:yes gene_type:complete